MSGPRAGSVGRRGGVTYLKTRSTLAPASKRSRYALRSVALEFEHYSQKVADAFVQMPSHTALPDFLGVRFTEAGPGRLVAEMEVRPDLLTPFGNLHGGVIAVLVDHVLGSVMYPVMPRGWWAATTEYKVNNLAPVREGTLRAVADIIAMTRRTSVVRIDVLNGDRLVCVAQGTCLLQEPKKEG